MHLRLYKNHPTNWFDDFEKSLDTFWNSPMWAKNQSFSPACDFYENKDYYYFNFDIPGVRKEDLHIEISDNTLHISGEKKREYKEKAIEGKHFYEKFYGKFQRSFTLPSAVKENGVEAHFKNGVLELLIPKQTESKGKKITVKEENKGDLFSKLLKKTS